MSVPRVSVYIEASRSHEDQKLRSRHNQLNGFRQGLENTAVESKTISGVRDNTATQILILSVLITNFLRGHSVFFFLFLQHRHILIGTHFRVTSRFESIRTSINSLDLYY